MAAPADQLSLVVERIPFEAQNALRGDASAFDALGQEHGAPEDLGCERRFERTTRKLDPAWSKFSAAAGTVADARAAVESIQAANQETRELAPKLLSELGDLASAVGVQKLEGMSRYLERFELTVQRIQQELNGLGSGVSDAGPTAQRLADSLEFLNQVMRGLSGEESGLALTRVIRRRRGAAVEDAWYSAISSLRRACARRSAPPSPCRRRRRPHARCRRWRAA